MRSVFLAGAFGQRNPGDEALAEAFVAALPRGWEAVVTTAEPAAAEASLGARAVDVRDARAVAAAAARADAIVLAGGTVFKALHPVSGRPRLALLSRAVALTSAARALGKPVAMVGVGAGELEGSTARALARRLVRQADLLVLRDEESAAALEAAGAPAPFRIGADAAWTLLDRAAAQRRAPAGGGPVVVALSVHAGGPALAGWLVAALAPLAEAGHELILQPWQVLGGTGDDLDLARSVAEQLDGRVKVADPPASLQAASAAYIDAGLVVALRFHAAVAAAAAGAPLVAVAHEPKLAGLARRLEQTAVDPALAPGELTAAAVAGVGRVGPSRAAVQGQVAAAEEGFRLLRLLLTGGAVEQVQDISGLPLEPAP